MEREYPIIEIAPDKTEEETSEQIKIAGNVHEIIIFMFLSMSSTQFIILWFEFFHISFL